MPVTFENCRAIRDHGKGLLVLIPELDDEPIWIPHSGIHKDSDVYRVNDDDDHKLIVKDWLAEKRGWD